MEPNSIVQKWCRRNWPLVITGVVLSVGIGVLLMRSNEYSSPPKVEAAVVMIPGEAVVIPGRATVVTPGDNSAAMPSLVSDTRVVD